MMPWSRGAHSSDRSGARRVVAVLAALAVLVVTGLVTVQSASAAARSRHGRNRAAPSATASASSAARPSTTPSTSQTTPPSGAQGTGTTVAYSGIDTVIANPERGLAHLTRCDNQDLSTATLSAYRTTENISVLWCMFYLTGYQAKDLDSAVLARLGRQFSAVRSAGLKMVLRFAYTDNESGDDAAPATVLRHIAQLKPYLRDNSDVILTLQAGFVGAWGEWYYTQHFGNQGQVSATDGANRRAVLDALLDAVGEARMVQLRTPAFKRGFFGTGPLPESQAYGGTARARVGFHNDCFLASDDDMGTYGDPATEKPYLAAETTFQVMGGETCATNSPRSSCTTATSELAQFHWTFLNTDYHPDVISAWRSGGCLPTIQRNLGYRIVLQQGVFPATAARSTGLPVRITLRNDGWSAPANPRRVEVVLRSGDSAAVRRIAVTGVDPRSWRAGATATIDLTVALPTDLAAGSYQLALALPDPATTLGSRPEYAIRTANAGLWDPANGWNNLNHTVTITG